MIQAIKVSPNYPNQTVNFTARGQNISLILQFTGYQNEDSYYEDVLNDYAPPQFYASIFISNVPIIQDTAIVNLSPINTYPSTMNGYIVSYDTTNQDNNPTIDNIGVTVLFYYIDNLSEIDNIKTGNIS